MSRSVTMPFSLGVPQSDAAAIEAIGISKHFGTLTALSEVSLAVQPGELISIIGPSGCGKSTLFHILAGVEAPSEGRVVVAGDDTTGQAGRVGYMLQKDLLMPWKSLLDNTILGLELQGVPRRQARNQARLWFPRFGLDGFEQAYPHQLSGGMKQRAALLRTFLAQREVLLLDEPFGALDALTRADMHEWLLDIWREFARTIVLVTHDVDEAIFLADRVYVMTPRPGTIAGVVSVPLSRPREYQTTVTSPAFVTVKRAVFSLLRQGAQAG